MKTLSDFRDEADMNQQTLAVEAGVSVTTVSEHERGISQPNLSTLFSYADALNVDAKELLEFFKEARE